jgi:hypothetical protein
MAFLYVEVDLTGLATDSRPQVDASEMLGLGIVKEQAHRIHPDAVIDHGYLPLAYPFELGCNPE